jgi:hypothetical protein
LADPGSQEWMGGRDLLSFAKPMKYREEISYYEKAAMGVSEGCQDIVAGVGDAKADGLAVDRSGDAHR